MFLNFGLLLVLSWSAVCNGNVYKISLKYFYNIVFNGEHYPHMFFDLELIFFNSAKKQPKAIDEEFLLSPFYNCVKVSDTARGECLLRR